MNFAPALGDETVSNASLAAPAPQACNLVLQAVGRTPNGKKIAADKAGVRATPKSV